MDKRNLKLKKNRGISRVNGELELEGYKPATSKDVIATYLTMINLEEKKLKELQDDEMQPMIVKILAKGLLKKNTGAFDILEKILDRGIGKAINRQENINKNIVITIKNYEGEGE